MKKLNLIAFVYFFTLLLSIALNPIYAQSLSTDAILEKNFEEDMKLKLEFFRLLMRSADSIDQKIDQELKASGEKTVNDQRLIKILKDEMQIMTNLYAKTLSIPEGQIGRLNDYYKTLRFQKFIEIFHKAKLNIEVFFKRKGFGIGLAILAGLICEFTVPVVLTHLGLAKFIPLSMMTPWGLIYSFVPGLTYKWRINQKIKAELKSPIKYQAYLEQMIVFKKELESINIFEKLIPINFNGEQIAIGIKAKNHIQKVYELSGLDKNSLNFKNLMTLVETEKIDISKIQNIINRPTLDQDLKLAYLINYIFDSNNPKNISLFNERFKNDWVEVKSKPHYQAFLKWTFETSKITSKEDLFQAIKRLPRDVSIKEFLVVYEEIILSKHLADLDLPFREAREYVIAFDVLKGKLISLEENAPVEKYHQEIFDFVSKTFLKTPSSCSNSPSVILNYLKAIP